MQSQESEALQARYRLACELAKAGLSWRLNTITSARR
ncbi:inositol monophosphatase family protein [Klebsiella variicola]|uniref:Inositol monophosphatase family protein n=1 Tax=Klebsiella variicola TaxID=244366 RepID=A0A7H4MFI4_KLEVA|nr:inositol monophosphatase family protein [Klebsiella variicola]